MQNRVVAVLIVFFILFSLLPTGYELVNRSRLFPERAFELVHNFPTDYNFYLSRIRQGLVGRTTVVEQYTGEPHEGSFIQVFYLVLGWVGKWWRVPWGRVADIYHVARIVFGGLLLVMIAQFCKRSFFILHSKFSILAFLLAVTASTWPKLVFYEGGWRFGGFMPWWSVMDSLQRITFIPHILAGQALIIALLLMLTNDRAMKKGGSWIFAGFLGFVLGIIFPPGLLFVYAVLGILFLFQRKHTIGYGVFFFLSVPALGYLKLMTSFYPWKRLVEVDIIRPLPFDYVEYVKAMGPVLPLGLIGLLVALLRKEKAMLLSVAWVVAWLLLLFAFRFVPQQSPLRFSEMIPHAPLAVLTGYLFFLLWRLRKSFVICHLSFVIPTILIIVGSGVMLSSFWWQRDFVNHKIIAAYPLVPTGSYVMYPLKDFASAIQFLDDTTPRDSVILSETTAGNYIPARTARRVYLGHDNTVKYEEKQVVVKQFFSGKMKPDAAKDFLIKNNLHHVFFGPQEREDGGIVDLSKAYPFLQSIYSNTYVIVYVVK